MSYDKSEIMKRAHELRRTRALDKSAAMKCAWAEAKARRAPAAKETRVRTRPAAAVRATLERLASLAATAPSGSRASARHAPPQAARRHAMGRGRP